MKNNFYLSLLIILFSLSLNAQNDSYCGIIVDGVKAEKIDCWSFEKMDLVFPMNDKYKKYDRIETHLFIVPENSDKVETDFFLSFSPESFSDNFNGGVYGVWRFMQNKKTDEAVSNYSEKFDRRKFAKFRRGFCIQFFVKAFTFTGYTYGINGNKEATYGNGVILYKSEKCPMVVGKYDENASCSVTGQKWNLKIDKSPAYNDAYGVIKENTSVKIANTNKAVESNKGQDENPSSLDSKGTSGISVNQVSPLKPLDKSKSGYFVEKDGNVITSEGYRNKNGESNGEVRNYDSNGKLESIYTYINGQRNGPASLFDTESGKIIESGNYKNDNKDGVWKRYKDGKVVGSDTYVNGEKQ